MSRIVYSTVHKKYKLTNEKEQTYSDEFSTVSIGEKI